LEGSPDVGFLLAGYGGCVGTDSGRLSACCGPSPVIPEMTESWATDPCWRLRAGPFSACLPCFMACTARDYDRRPVGLKMGRGTIRRILPCADCAICNAQGQRPRRANEHGENQCRHQRDTRAKIGQLGRYAGASRTQGAARNRPPGYADQVLTNCMLAKGLHQTRMTAGSLRH